MSQLNHTYRCTCGEGMHIARFDAGRLSRCPRCSDFIIVPTEVGELAAKPDFRLATPRLGLDLTHPRNWREIHEIYSDPRNFDYEISVPSTERDTRVALKTSAFPRGFAKSGILKYQATEKVDQRIIGTVTISFVLPYYSASVGFMFHQEYQGRGYGTEAVTEICSFLLNKLKLERICASCDERNAACRGLLDNVGFELEGISRKWYHHPEQGWINAANYGLLREPPDADSKGE